MTHSPNHHMMDCPLGFAATYNGKPAQIADCYNDSFTVALLNEDGGLLDEIEVRYDDPALDIDDEPPGAGVDCFERAMMAKYPVRDYYRG